MTKELIAPEQIQLYELDEDLEICGRRTARLDEHVIPAIEAPKSIRGIRLDTSDCFTFIDEVAIGWFEHEECPEYELSNKGRYYLEIQMVARNVGEELYDKTWDIFRQHGIDRLTKSFGLESWSIGKGIVDRRGQDIFVVELPGFDLPQWHLYFSVGKGNTYGNCWTIAERVERFVETELMALSKGQQR